MYAKALKPFVFILMIMAMVSIACMGGSGAPTNEPAPVILEPTAVIIEATPLPVEPSQPVFTDNLS